MVEFEDVEVLLHNTQQPACFHDFKSPESTLAELKKRGIVGVRLQKDGPLWLPRANPVIEKELDKLFHRIEPLKWDVKLPNYDVLGLKDVHIGQLAHIVGKGPSLDRLPCPLDGGPILAINEAIHKVESLGMTGYVVTQDYHIDCMPKFSTLLLHQRLRASYVTDLPVYLFNGCEPFKVRSQLTVLHAMCFAKLFGCVEAHLHCFDACVSGKTTYADCIGHGPTNSGGAGADRFLKHKELILNTSRDLGLPVKFFTY